MTKIIHPIRILTLLAFCLIIGQSVVNAQESDFTISGKVLETGSGQPMQQAILSIASTGEFTSADTAGNFFMNVPSQNELIIVNYPGYRSTEVYTNGQDNIVIYLNSLEYLSDGETYKATLGIEPLRDATNAVTMLSKSEFELSGATSFEQNMVGKIPGLHIVEHSGMPGHSSWMNIRGISSIFGRNEPVVFMDDMIHEINYPNNVIIEGHRLNPMDIVDFEDIVDVTVIKAGEGHMGSAGSNGLININTEQKEGTSAKIILKLAGGVAFQPKHQSVLAPDQFRAYWHDLLNSEGYGDDEINSMYPWLYGGSGADEYYRYNNNTDWQKEQFQSAGLQKYYVFLRGGDDIATYNISTGYVAHNTSFSNWKYSRFNLRLNGQVNITKKLSVIPDTKLALTDNKLSNMGPTIEHNPIVAGLQKSPLMTAHERSAADGTELFPYDDVGAFDISNPGVLIDKALGSTRNNQILASVKLKYDITPELTIATLIGTSVNNDRANIFIPDIGVVQIDSAMNSPQDMVTEFRSTQSLTNIVYKTAFKNHHYFTVDGGLRIMMNTYKNNIGIDLNTPSDDFRSLGSGSGYEYLRSNGGQLNELRWTSYYANIGYNFRKKYYVRASLSYDGSSVFNDENRYNFYPSVFGAWRLSSERFLSGSSWLNDMKLRASYSQTGNMFNSIYTFSKMTYTGRRYNQLGTVIRDYNPNEELEVERKSTINAGLDLAFGKKAYGIHIDYYYSTVGNLIINQSLPYNYGFTDYFDNGGALSQTGIELGVDGRIYMGNSILELGATVTWQTSKVTKMDFINPETSFLTREVTGAEYIASIDNPVNAFYGYTTNGIYNSDAEANGIIGPSGREMGAGDIIFVDTDGNNIIDENDKDIIGDPNPDFYGALSAVLTIKRFEISALFTYSIGNDMYNFVRYKTTSMIDYANQSADVTNRWKQGVTNAELPKATVNDPNGNNVFSDRWIEDASYVRVKELKVSYTSPNLFSLEKEVVLYVTGTNLFTFTKYTGYSPETMYLNDPYYMGIDYGKLPQTPSIIFGIQLSL